MTQSNELQRFVFPDTGQSVRTFLIDGEPWFVAADVCELLGYTRVADALRIPDEDDLGTHFVRGHDERDRPAQIVSEPGLYSLILRSNRPEAKAFKRWITHEVLPAIRRTGSYSIPAQVYAIPISFAEALELAARQARELEVVQAKVAELEPEAARAAQTMDADGLALVGTIGKRFGLKEKALREFLYAQGLLIRHGLRRNEPMARYVQSGHFEVKVTLVGEPVRERSTTYVTPKGEALIWKRLYEAGVVGSPRPPARQLVLAEL
ncbi:phage antirepressor [Microtetraspora malaysiensis]|uniref:Phage antirepressor n=1 Tax=Microtetraspora malaysiensis TaxID=161358 RepID=A0ABW6T318_9ACTN